MIEIILIIAGLIIAVVGLIGCVVPAVPGPPLNLVSLLLLEIAAGGTYSSGFYIFWIIITALTILLDYMFPIWSAKKFNARGYGIWGSVIGMLMGIIFFPPFGMIIGLFLGAVLGELIAGRKSLEAMKVGMVTFLSSMFMIVVKLAASFIMTYYFITAAVSYLL